MKADLNIPKVIGVELAAVRRKTNDELWDIIIINRNSLPLKNVIIASKGYGSNNGKNEQTSVLRHLIETVSPNSYARIEPIQKDVFHLTNEYWVSYYLKEEIYDKKYIFLPDSIQEKYASNIQGFDIYGVLHK